MPRATLQKSVERSSPGESSDPIASPELIRIVEYAAAAARQSRRREVNGAIVLAAIVGDGRSAAASMLRDQGLTFEEAIKALQKVNATARSAGQPPTQSAPEPGHQAAPEAQSGGPEAGRPVSREPYLVHNQRNGPSGLTTEDILAAARRRVATGINGSRRPEAESARQRIPFTRQSTVERMGSLTAAILLSSRSPPLFVRGPKYSMARTLRRGPRACLPMHSARRSVSMVMMRRRWASPFRTEHSIITKVSRAIFVSPEPAPRGSNHVRATCSDTRLAEPFSNGWILSATSLART